MIFLPFRAQTMHVWYIKIIENDSMTWSWHCINFIDHKQNVQLIQYELTADETTRWVGGIQIRLWWSRSKNSQISTFWDNFFWKKLIFLPSRARAMRLWFIKLIKNDLATSSWPYINLVDHKKMCNSSSMDLWQMVLLREDRWGVYKFSRF